MYDERGEPSETLVEHWNSHNDHAGDGDDEPDEVREPTQAERDAWMDQVERWGDEVAEPPIPTGADEVVYADEAEYGRDGS
jgi:hypothetical protein